MKPGAVSRGGPRFRVFVNAYRLRNEPEKPFLQVLDTHTGTLQAAFRVGFPDGAALVADLDGMTIPNVDHADHPHLPEQARYVCWVEADRVEF